MLHVDPELDLYFERIIDITPAQVWAAWTVPEHLLHWFTPAPWKTVECEIDLQPGGIFRSVMHGPEGQIHNNAGCFLEVIENKRLVWTDAFTPGYRPSAKPFFTAIISMEAVAEGTKYMALARHGDAAIKQQHEAMGFKDGWGKALDQLVAHMKQQ